ncbi:mas-related G-protein coupled receptor member H-like [Pogona vitticeps]
MRRVFISSCSQADMSFPEEAPKENMNLVTNFTFSILPLLDPTMESNATYNASRFSSNSSYIPEDDNFYRLRLTVFLISTLLVSLFGMAVNGTVIWILGCRMNRNSFTIYILNLSIADFALLTVLAQHSICSILNFFHYMDYTVVLFSLLSSLFLFAFSTSQFLLAVISIDRCICIFLPLWHKCHRPPHLSTILCVAVWILTFLISAIDFSLFLSIQYAEIWYHQFLLNAVLCMPAISISTIAMLIKVCFMSPHLKQRKLLTAILLALLFFLFFGFPMNAFRFFFRYRIPASSYFNFYALMGATLNSAINPVIYFLVGRNKKTQSSGRLMKILEKLFQEGEYCREETESTLETCL